jgi:hypothetical protein
MESVKFTEDVATTFLHLSAVNVAFVNVRMNLVGPNHPLPKKNKIILQNATFVLGPTSHTTF